jgi:hypothetical protein
MITVVDYIGEIVQKTSEKVKNVISSDVFYQFGHITEINNTFSSYSKTEEFRKQKYPAILLLQDFAEKMSIDQTIETQVRLQLLIVAASTQTDRAAERYIKVFKPVLYLIYEQFIKMLNKDDRLNTPYSGVPHEKIDRPLVSGAWVETTNGKANLFNDHLDAIEIRNLQLIILKTC